MAEHVTEILAFDKSAIRIDDDGRLHREATPVTKANVCPYLGSEIPGAAALGLQPTLKYWLLRDPEELAKAAPSFNNIPILDQHVAVSAADHQPDRVVGSTGTDAEFDGEYIRVSVVVWAGDSIEGIRSKRKRELSSSYRYTADMTRGTYNGEHYDGVMRNISANHVAIVEVGRAGSDVLVGDSLPEGLRNMKTVLSPRGMLVHGMLAAMMAPKLAMDSGVALAPLLSGVTAANWRAKLPGLKASLKATTTGKLAADATLDDVIDLLDRVEAAVENVEEEPAAKVDDDEETDEERAERMKKREKAAKDKAKDAEPEPDDKKKKDDKVDKTAMDSAIKDAVATATANTIARMNELRAAENAVRPFVGDLNMPAMDSAESVYKFCLGVHKIPTEGVPPAAFGAMVAMLPKPGSVAPSREVLAQDAAGAAATVAKRFPSVQFAKIGG